MRGPGRSTRREAGSSAAEWADNGLDQKECVHGALLLTAGPWGQELLRLIQKEDDKNKTSGTVSPDSLSPLQLNESNCLKLKI